MLWLYLMCIACLSITATYSTPSRSARCNRACTSGATNGQVFGCKCENQGNLNRHKRDSEELEDVDVRSKHGRVKRSEKEDSDMHTPSTMVFRWGKRTGDNNDILNNPDLMRLKKKYEDEASKSAGYGHIFRWGKRSPLWIPGTDELQAVDGGPLKRIFRWGKRSDEGQRSLSPAVFRWGKRSFEDAPYQLEKREDKYGGLGSVFRWGKRADDSLSMLSGASEYVPRDDFDTTLKSLMEWPDKRAAEQEPGDLRNKYASVFRWGKRHGGLGDEYSNNWNIKRSTNGENKEHLLRTLHSLITDQALKRAYQ